MLEYIIKRCAEYARQIKFIAPLIGVALLCAGLFQSLVPSASALGDVRTISLYNMHTKESLKITFKRNGQFNEAALTKINYFMRDWRANRPTKMDPALIDLLWELHEELGSKKPIHLVSGFRSTKTNNMLRRIGRKTAKRSMHIQGRAADVFFPDVPVKKLRESALLRERGGVGYYPRSGKYGFVHVDTGNVRHWPRMSPVRYAALMKRRKPWHRKPAAIQVAKLTPRSPERRPSFRLASGPTNLTPGRSVPLPRQKPLLVAALETNIPRPRSKPMFTATVEPVMAALKARMPVVTASLNPSAIFSTASVRADTAPSRPYRAQKRPGLMISTAGVKGLRGTVLPVREKVGPHLVINRSRKGNLLMSLHGWTPPKTKPPRQVQKAPQGIRLSSLN